MPKKILILDPFVKEPVNNSYNQLIRFFPKASFFLYQPSINSILNLEYKDSYDAIILLGSGSNLCENLKWHKELIDFHKEMLQKEIPTLGICFGHQLLAFAFGSDIDYFSKEDDKIEGVREVGFRGKKYQLGVSHRQVITKLSSEFNDESISKFSFDVITHKNLPLWATQTHPEGSEFFLKNTCMVDSEDQIKKCIEDGRNFIKCFLDFYKII